MGKSIVIPKNLEGMVTGKFAKQALVDLLSTVVAEKPAEKEEPMAPGTGLTFVVEYGALTRGQLDAGQDRYIVCNLNILLMHNGTALGNIVGNKITVDSAGNYVFDSCSDKSGGGFYNFTGFSKAAKEAIIKKARQHEMNGTLVTKWSARFDYNPKGRSKGKAMVVRDGKVEPEAKVKGFTKPAPAFSG